MSGAATNEVRNQKHRDWLARRAYNETFRTAPSTFPIWRGIPKRCPCGCGEIWYDKLSPVNWWTYLSPDLLWKTQFLYPVFGALFKVVWYARPVVLTALFGFSLFDRKTTGSLVFYGAGFPLSILLKISFWVLSVLGILAVALLWPVSLALMFSLIVALVGIAVIAISSRSLVFILGGAASVIFSFYPYMGIVLIVIGVLLEYESKRRSDQRIEENIGKLTLMIHKSENDLKEC